jgi:[glutamine synthetase] adenylyltransferase / [glutamine synthetase]-adenylyl-L-tyrosine phosphorylase
MQPLLAQNDRTPSLDQWRAQPGYARLSEDERARLEALVPVIVESAGKTATPAATLVVALDLVLRMAAWPRYLHTFANHTGAITRLVALVGASPWLGQLLLARPALADELLPGRNSDRPPDRATLARSLQETLRRCADDEPGLMIALCNFKHSVILQVLALDLEGALTLDQVSAALSDLADVLLSAILSRVSERLGHGSVSPVGIVAYGKLGSREMSYASDTDIVFLHEDAPAECEPAFTRLASTVNRWLTTATAAGTLYETDFRLRPYGTHGLLTSSLSGFGSYQETAAWTWEHQALTRARFVAGDPRVGQRFAQLRRQILARPRQATVLHTDVLAMRQRIAESRRKHAPGAGLFDVKHSRGGIIDVEFAVQYSILARAAAHPQLLEAPDNATALAICAELGLVSPDLAQAATQAFRSYRLWMHRERLRGNEVVLVPAAQAESHRTAVLSLWQHVFGTQPGPISMNQKPVPAGETKDA